MKDLLSAVMPVANDPGPDPDDPGTGGGGQTKTTLDRPGDDVPADD